MTKKHFIALAKALRSQRPAFDERKEWERWTYMRNAVAQVCADFNPNFDRARFIAATEA